MTRDEAKVDAIVVDSGEGLSGPVRRINYRKHSSAGPMFDLVELRDQRNQFAGYRYLNEIRLATPQERATWKVDGGR